MVTMIDLMVETWCQKLYNFRGFQCPILPLYCVSNSFLVKNTWNNRVRTNMKKSTKIYLQSSQIYPYSHPRNDSTCTSILCSKVEGLWSTKNPPQIQLQCLHTTTSPLHLHLARHFRLDLQVHVHCSQYN